MYNVQITTHYVTSTIVHHLQQPRKTLLDNHTYPPHTTISCFLATNYITAQYNYRSLLQFNAIHIYCITNRITPSSTTQPTTYRTPITPA